MGEALKMVGKGGEFNAPMYFNGSLYFPSKQSKNFEDAQVNPSFIITKINFFKSLKHIVFLVSEHMHQVRRDAYGQLQQS